ncbi:MAG: hypothetical protein QXI67_07100 [Candidatus Bathyarchaeia archaeon]
MLHNKSTLRLIEKMNKCLSLSASKVFQKRRKLLRSKLIQKFAYNMMRKNWLIGILRISLAGGGLRERGLNIIVEQYPKYAAYLKILREKADL